MSLRLVDAAAAVLRPTACAALSAATGSAAASRLLVLANRHHVFRPFLVPAAQAPGSSRDLLLLDIALESWLRMLVERQDKRALSGDDLVELMSLVLGNAALAGNSPELELVAAQWEAVRNYPDRWGRRCWLAGLGAQGARV